MTCDTASPSILITGGARGIGLAVAARFAAGGYAVAIADIDQPEAERAAEHLLANGSVAIAVKTDVSDESAVRRLIEVVSSRLGRLDVLCNNAGIEAYSLTEDCTVEEWDAHIGVNLRGAFLCMKHAMPMLRVSRGSVINISSVQALACEPRCAPYSASKGGMLSLTRAAALDYAAEGVRVNALCPGAIESRMMEEYLSSTGQYAACRASLSKRIPLGRIGTPEDIANAVWFLASSDAGYITGSTMVVDGGLLARHAL